MPTHTHYAPYSRRSFILMCGQGVHIYNSLLKTHIYKGYYLLKAKERSSSFFFAFCDIFALGIASIADFGAAELLLTGAGPGVVAHPFGLCPTFLEGFGSDGKSSTAGENVLFAGAFPTTFCVFAFAAAICSFLFAPAAILANIPVPVAEAEL